MIIIITNGKNRLLNYIVNIFAFIYLFSYSTIEEVEEEKYAAHIAHTNTHITYI